MSAIQRFLFAILPETWATAIERESRTWMAQCPCGFTRSIWEHGGIRWKATRHARRLLVCPGCGQARVHTVDRSPTTPTTA